MLGRLVALQQPASLKTQVRQEQPWQLPRCRQGIRQHCWQLACRPASCKEISCKYRAQVTLRRQQQGYQQPVHQLQAACQRQVAPLQQQVQSTLNINQPSTLLHVALLAKAQVEHSSPNRF